MKRASTRITTRPIVLSTLLLVASVALTPRAQSASTEQPPACDIVEIPNAIHAPDHLRRCMKKMLEKSATFRAQCHRFADAPQLHVDVQVDAGITSTSQRARTRILRVSGGAIFAWVTVTPFGDPTEWVAHEFEHVIEQVEGVPLGDLAAARRGVWLSGADMFETDRAIQVGRQVADEVRSKTY